MHQTVRAEQTVRVREAGPRRSVARVELRRLEHEGNPLLDRRAAAIQQYSRLEIRLVRFDALGRSLVERQRPILLQRRLEALGDRGRDLVLHGEDVLDLTVVAFRPEVIARRHVDQLRGDPHSLGRLAHGSLEHRAHADLIAERS